MPYSSKSNAIRAARKAGLDVNAFQFFALIDGRWDWAPASPATALIVANIPVISPDNGAAWAALYDEPRNDPDADQAGHDDDGCPKGDPECLNANGDCHEACEAPAAPRPGKGKAAALVAAAASPGGITNAEIKALTGWTKLGGFFGAVKRSGMTLNRVREARETRWFATRAL